MGRFYWGIHWLDPGWQGPLCGDEMGKGKRKQELTTKRSREDLAKHFMDIRLQEAERKAQEYARTLEPRALEAS